MTPTVVSYAALGLGLIALAVATMANRRWSRGKSAHGPDAGTSDMAAQLTRELAELRASIELLSQANDRIAEVAATGLRHVALVRYDAFGDVGGRLSYSAALVDDTSSGLVITTLSGKSDVRTYIKAISGGQAEGALTPEEAQAITFAVGSHE